MQYRVEFSIGLGFRADGTTISYVDREIIVDNIRRHASTFMGGGFVGMGRGFWRPPGQQNPISEPTLVLSSDIWASDVTEFRLMAKELALIAEQRAVHVSAHATYAVDVDTRGEVSEGS